MLQLTLVTRSDITIQLTLFLKLGCYERLSNSVQKFETFTAKCMCLLTKIIGPIMFLTLLSGELLIWLTVFSSL